MVIPLFTFHFFRDSYCLCPIWNNYAQKQRLGGNKTTLFCSIQCYTQNETIPKNKKVYLSKKPIAKLHQMTHLSSDVT